MSGSTSNIKTRRNGQGTCERRNSDSRWRLRWYDLRGVRRERLLAATLSREDAERELRAIVAERDRGVPVVSRTHTLRSWMPVWMDTLAPSTVRDSTRRSYRRYADRWSADAIGAHRLAELLPEHVGAALARQARAGVPAGSRAFGLSCLRRALDAAVISGHAGRNVARMIEAPKVDPRPIAPPRGTDLDRLRAAMADDDLEALWLLLSWMGLRKGEALALRWGSVQGPNILVDATLSNDGKIVGPTKTRAGRRLLWIPPQSGIESALRRLADRTYGAGRTPPPAAFLFLRPDGRPLTGKQAWDRWALLCGRAGTVHYRPHDLRHLAISAMHLAGTPAGVIRAYVGWSTSRLLDRYAHADQERPDWTDLGSARDVTPRDLTPVASDLTPVGDPRTGERPRSPRTSTDGPRERASVGAGSRL